MKRPACALPVCWLLMLLLLSSCHSCQAQPPVQQDTGYTYQKPAPGGTGKVYMGREIAAIMSSTGGSWLERDTRQDEENSSLAIRHMRLQPNSVVADIGAGTGFYTFRMARLVPQGKVYAIEVQDRFVRSLKDRQQELDLRQVEVVKGDEKSVNVPDGSLDLALMVDVYHELEYPQEMLQAIHKALKPDGRLVLMEYRAEDPDVRIRELHKMTAGQVKKELEANGFRLERREDALPIQHFLVFEKNGR